MYRHYGVAPGIGCPVNTENDDFSFPVIFMGTHNIGAGTPKVIGSRDMYS